ncbi:hypothetical protein IMZ48_45365 [Candidatus Bathyarchaeota archaeon]|nr:hypothetical protein [Candidatus Bathyarchaeota archaeon]
MAELVGKHIAIHLQTVAGGRTDYYSVTKRLGGLLGWVRWYGPWRCWCFLPCEGTVWSADCLEDIVRFIKTKPTAPAASGLFEEGQA